MSPQALSVGALLGFFCFAASYFAIHIGSKVKKARSPLLRLWNMGQAMSMATIAIIFGCLTVYALRSPLLFFWQ